MASSLYGVAAGFLLLALVVHGLTIWKQASELKFEFEDNDNILYELGIEAEDRPEFLDPGPLSLEGDYHGEPVYIPESSQESFWPLRK